MPIRSYSRLLLSAFVLAAYGGTGTRAAPVRETVFFPFDDYSLPSNKALLLNLVPGSKAAKDYGLKLLLVGHPIRLRIGWEGRDADLVRLYALYID